VAWAWSGMRGGAVICWRPRLMVAVRNGRRRRGVRPRRCAGPLGSAGQSLAVVFAIGAGPGSGAGASESLPSIPVGDDPACVDYGPSRYQEEMIIPGLLGVVHERGSGPYLNPCGEGRPSGGRRGLEQEITEYLRSRS
jgi:hypothetical protein